MKARVLAFLAAFLGVSLLVGLVFAGAAQAVDAPTPSSSPSPSASPAACAFGAVGCTTGTPLATVSQPSEQQPSGVSSLPAVSKEAAEAATTVLHDTFGWWLKTPSVAIGSGGVLKLQATMLGIAGIVLMLLVIFQGIRMMTTRRGAPFAELVRGSVIAAVVVAAGVALVDTALVASDKLGEAILALSFPDSDALVKRMTDVMLGSGVKDQPPTLLLLFSLIVLVTGLVQAVLLFLRQTAVPMLGVILPIAGVGQAGPPATQTWLPKVLSLIFAIVLYKPVVVVILTVGFVQISGDPTLLDAIRGAVTLVVCVLAFPAMLRLFAPLSHTLATRGGGLAVESAAAFGASFARRGAGTPGDTTAIQHAAFMQGAGSAPAPGGAGGSGASGAAGAAGASASAAATSGLDGSSGRDGAGRDGSSGTRGGKGTDGHSGRPGADAPVPGLVVAGDVTHPAVVTTPSTGPVQIKEIPVRVEVPVRTEVVVNGASRPGDK